MEINIGEIIIDEEVNIGELQLDITIERPEYETLKITPTTEEQIREGRYNKVIIEGDSNLISENIKKDIEIFGVTGVAETGNTEILLKIDGMYTQIQRYLTKIPMIDTSQKKYMTALFYLCENLTEIPEIDTGTATKMDDMFMFCKKIKQIPEIDTSNVTDMYRMFYGCNNLKSIPELNTINVTKISQMFYECLELTSIPELNTSSAVNMYGMFWNCHQIKKIPELNAQKANYIDYIINGCYVLTDFGGLKDIGKAYTKKSNNNSNYRFELDDSPLLTHASLINVINGLYDLNLTYDVANGGTLYSQSLVLGSTNRTKLTEEEIAIATSKGWNVS